MASWVEWKSGAKGQSGALASQKSYPIELKGCDLLHRICGQLGQKCTIAQWDKARKAFWPDNVCERQFRRLGTAYRDREDFNF